MARFFFHSEDGEMIVDTDGRELTCSASARTEALKLTREAIATDPRLLLGNRKWRLVVADENSEIVFKVEVSTEVGRAP